MQQVFQKHDVAFLCGFGAQAQIAVFKYSDGPLIPASVRRISRGMTNRPAASMVVIMV